MKITHPIYQKQITIIAKDENGEDITYEFMNYIATVLNDAAKYNKDIFPLTAKDDYDLFNEIYKQLKIKGYYDEI